MSIHKAKARWEGNLPKGKGIIALENLDFKGAYSFKSRFEDGKGTSPEEMIGGALAGCFSMALSNMLDQEGFTPQSIDTTAQVTLAKAGDGFEISEIMLSTTGNIAEIDEKRFAEIARKAKNNCPVSKALAGVNINLKAKLAD